VRTPRSIRRLICAWPALASSFNYNNCHPWRNGKSLSGWTQLVLYTKIFRRFRRPEGSSGGRKYPVPWNASNCPTVEASEIKMFQYFYLRSNRTNKRRRRKPRQTRKTLTGVADQMTRKIFIRRHPRARSNFFPRPTLV
jgi:hypothetical protein